MSLRGRRARPRAALLAPPRVDAPVIAREQHLGNAPAAELGGAGVVRVLDRAVERRAERLLERRAGVAEGAGELAQERVADHHRGELAAGEHVASDRDHVRAEVLDDALVKALVATAQKRQRSLGRELLHESLIEER